MPIRNNRKQRTLENLIRKIAVEVATQIARKEALATALREISAYDYEKNKPAVVTADDLMGLFDDSGSLFNSLSQKSEAEIKEQQERAKQHAVEMYEALGVPYGTPLYYGKGMKLKVYPEYYLPINYTGKTLSRE